MKRETNVEFVTRLMEFAPTGAMSQLFVTDALIKRAEYVVDREADILAAMENHILDAQAWVAIAKWIKEQIEARNV